MFSQILSWIGYVFPTYYVFRLVTDLTVLGADFSSVALYTGILVAIIALLGIIVINVVRRLSTQALRING
jgi:ABC-2 type transport system permease protein